MSLFTDIFTINVIYDLTFNFCEKNYGVGVVFHSKFEQQLV